MSREVIRASLWGLGTALVLGILVVVGSRRLEHFDAALVAYTFATLFAAFGIAYRYAMWLQRPPTALYWRRGWQAFFTPRLLSRNLAVALQRTVARFAANDFIFRRGRTRWAAHFLIMWGCILAAAITFPLVFGWIHFETVPGQLELYRAYVFGFPAFTFPVASFTAFLLFHGLIWSSIFVIAGVMLAMRRRMRDHGAAAVQTFGEDVLPLVLLFAISVTGVLIWVSYAWMHGYAYEFLAILHAVTVILTLLWLPFGKFFHVFQRPAQLGVAFYKDAADREGHASCARCHAPYAPLRQVEDLEEVERRLGYDYALRDGPAGHYQRICPRCRRALLALSQGGLWDAARAAPRDLEEALHG